MAKRRRSTPALEDILPVVFLEIGIEKKKIGRIMIQLRTDIVPKTAENFLVLCTGSAGYGYKNSIFHRIQPGFMCQGGDFLKRDGTGGVSIYGKRFDDENFRLRHREAGTVAMANFGPNTNSSQFYITFAATPWLDGQNVVIGKVVRGMEVLQQIGECGSEDGTPTKEVMIRNSGLYKRLL